MATPLSADALAVALAELTDWTGDARTLCRTVEAPSFLTGIRLVDAVAEAAEEADHHPDIDIRYRTVTFRLWTHTAGAVTAKDVALARNIDGLVATIEAEPAV
jgi:4a-hydroxytetrahydrobiopterin dehydratase